MNTRYAIALVYNENSDSTIDGVWIQDCTACTLKEAIEKAKATEKANSNRIKVAVVDAYSFGIQDYNLKKGLTRYDKERLK